jgi:alpha-mannosidase
MEKFPIATSHHQGLVTAGDLALYSRGLPEYEALQDETDTINKVALTLYRSVGYLSRGNLATRPGWAGPGYATPEAQMIGKYTFEYAMNFSGRASDADVTVMRRDYMHQAEHGFGGANINGLFSVNASHKIDQTALFPTEDGEAVVVRLDNPNNETVTVNLAGAFESAVKCEFDGKAPEGNAVDMHSFEIPPYAMVSVRLT